MDIHHVASYVAEGEVAQDAEVPNLTDNLLQGIDRMVRLNI